MEFIRLILAVAVMIVMGLSFCDLYDFIRHKGSTADNKHNQVKTDEKTIDKDNNNKSEVK